MGEQIEEETYTRHFEELGVEAESFSSDDHITSHHAFYMHDTTYRPYRFTIHLSTEQIKIPPTVTNTRDNYTRRRYTGFSTTLRYTSFKWH